MRVQLTTMRTREMREKDAKSADYRYKYSLVRVRTPDRCLVQVRTIHRHVNMVSQYQGVFSVNESLASVRQWLHSLLASPDSEFNLKDAATGTFKASSYSSVS